MAADSSGPERLDVVAIALNLIVAGLVLAKPSRRVIWSLSALGLIYLLYSFYQWMAGEGCHCFGEFISPGLVVVLDLFILAGSVTCLISGVGLETSCLQRPTSVVIGVTVGAGVFLTLVGLTNGTNRLRLPLAWNADSLVGEPIDDHIRFKEFSFVGRDDLEVYFFDVGCPKCVGQWQELSEHSIEDQSSSTSIAVWRLADQTWTSMELEFAPWIPNARKGQVHFPKGIPFLYTPARMDVRDGIIVAITHLE
ncbi:MULTISPECIES: hypothetical protein [Rhodopirellula]|uniref:hypothetical protein n=1 Tax=Rhodopirellula TaxID=265488 RepID=UPI0025804DA3|nr:hypothetical protein [Rhodopirellula sp. UBA1907]